MNKENKITINNLLYALLFLVFGIILATNQTGTIINFGSKIIGSILVIVGIVKAIIYIYMKGKLGEYSFGELIMSILLISLGVVLILFSEALLFSIKTIMGLWILFAGINKIILSISIRKIDKIGFRMFLITSIVMLILGVLLISGMLDDIIGILIIIYSIAEIVDYIYFKVKGKNYENDEPISKPEKKSKKIKKLKNTKVIDAVIEEDTKK